MLQDGSVLTKCNCCGHYRPIFNHCDVIGLQSYRVRGHRCRYQSKVRMRLPILVIYTDIPFCTVSTLSHIIVQILETLRF